MHRKAPSATASASFFLQSRGRTTDSGSRSLWQICLRIVLWVGCCASTSAGEKWLYVSRNLQLDKSVAEIGQLLRRGEAAGYTHLLLTDSKFSRLDSVIDRYFDNARQVQELARQHHIEIVPALFSMGYSNDLLFHDPNLAEALPVRGVPLVVQGGVAILDDPHAPTLRAGDMANLDRWSWHDDNVVPDDGAARLPPSDKQARLVQRLTLTPYRQYHIRVRIRTREFSAQPEIKVLTGDGRNLQWAYLGVERTQDWTEHHVVFNSLQYDAAAVYFGVWEPHTGELWWDDAVLEEVAFLNLVRREGAPLVIASAGRTLVEGTDFEPLSDPLMGTKPYPGEYTVYHAPPRLKTKLPDGTRLTADYYHAVTVHGGQVMICPSEPRTLELLRDQMRRMHDLWHADRYMMQHDEIRVFNHCAACQARNLTAGQLLAENARQCLGIIREIAPEARIYVWSDMFDPHHNAVAEPYYLVNGPYTDSWEGLDANVIPVVWYFEKRAESLPFFSGRGHRYLIAGYYDGRPQQARDWLETAATVPGCEGIMYTTWHRRYDDLEEFARVVDASQR